MLWETSKVEEANARVPDNEITIIMVDIMFQAVTNEFSECERDGQKKWITVVNSLHRRKVSLHA